MADDRPAESEVDQLARLQREFDDFRSTMYARVARSPTGDIEPTIRSAPKPDTLLLQGQAVLRGDWPVLWQWAQDQGLVGTPGLFTAGDGTTTFGLPDMRGLVLVGAGTRGADTYALGQIIGASTKALTVNNLPAHDHNVAVQLSQHEGHAHGVGGAGGHGGHNSGSASGAGGTGILVAANGNTGGGDHGHGTSIEGQGKPHSVTVNETAIGSGTPLDVRQASIGVNWLIWT